MADDGLRRIQDDLTEAFILREYADKYGIMTAYFKDKAILAYQNDPVFHARVKCVVAGVMDIIRKHEGGQGG